MILYVHNITPRLRYITDFISGQIGGPGFFTLTDDIDFYKGSNTPKINYSTIAIEGTEFFLSPQSILFERDTLQQQIVIFSVNDSIAFFKTTGDFPFDIFAASFYLLSRYEEYLPHTKDIYGRYAHENSLAYREKFLHLPLVNIWLRDFRKALHLKFPEVIFPVPGQQASFLPSYDIDQAYAFKHKPFLKNAGGFVKALLRGDTRQAGQRWRVLAGRAKDPFDAYEWMDDLHRLYNLKPHYFFIIAAQNGRYDKNNLPITDAMQELIVRHDRQYSIGIHPSWQSGDIISLIKSEIEQLRQITNHPIVNSRQHYIRFTLPSTFRYLIHAGIEHDFSMGYGSINGFRASVASPFYWFDLGKNEATTLLLHPFCYMDANSFFEQKYSPQQAYAEMKQYFAAVKEVNGTMLTIWHNNFLGTDPYYAGWKEMYEKFVAEVFS